MDSINMDARQKFNAMSNLLSPEQMPYESFGQRSPEFVPYNAPKHAFKSIAIAQILSPPVSPQASIVQPDQRQVATTDPILYPGQDALSRSSEEPLFHVEDTDTVVDSHMSARALRKKQFRDRELPPRDDYVLALEFKSQVHKLWAQDQRKWHTRELAYLMEDDKARAALKAKSSLQRIAPAPFTVKTTPKTISRVRPDKLPKATRPVKAKAARHPDTATPERIRNTTTTTREDRDFNALPDYCPPITTLPARTNSLKVDWKGAPIDLSSDPHRHLLHPDEVHLAANLRLDCATYLTSKRRIFIGVVAKYKEGGEFKKTHCQQACKIDVNKASKLWEAYKKVDWLNPAHFRKFL